MCTNPVGYTRTCFTTINNHVSVCCRSFVEKILSKQLHTIKYKDLTLLLTVGLKYLVIKFSANHRTQNQPSIRSRDDDDDVIRCRVECLKLLFVSLCNMEASVCSASSLLALWEEVSSSARLPTIPCIPPPLPTILWGS